MTSKKKNKNKNSNSIKQRFERILAVALVIVEAYPALKDVERCLIRLSMAVQKNRSTENRAYNTDWPKILADLKQKLDHFSQLNPPEVHRCDALLELGQELGTICQGPRDVQQADKNEYFKDEFDEERQQQLIKIAMAQYEAAITDSAKVRKAAHQASTRRTSKRRVRLIHADAIGIISLSKPITEMCAQEINAFYLACEQVGSLDFRTLDLNMLRTHMKCGPCNMAETTTPTYPYSPTASPEFPNKPPNSSAIPFVPGLFARGEVTREMLRHHNFLHIWRGTTSGILKVAGDDAGQSKGENALFVHIPCLKEVEAEPCYLRLAKLIATMAPQGYRATVNGAWYAAGCIGDLKSFGWHPAYFSDTPIQTYVDQPRILEEPVAEEIFNEVFTKIIASKAADEILNQMNEKALPSFGCVSTDLSTHKESLGSNFTISFDGFANQAHLDNDAFRFVFSIYIFVDEMGELITDPAMIEACMEDGHFLWPDLHLLVDTSRCNGVVVFYWRGTHERHCTMKGFRYDTKKKFGRTVTRYGTSVQVNRTLLSRTMKYHEEMINWEVKISQWELGGKQGLAPAKPVQPKYAPKQ